VVGWVTGAVQTGRIPAERVRRRLDSRSRMPHRALVGELLADVAEGVRSPLELRYLRDVELAHRLPTADRQVRRRGTVCDVWYREYATLVELDGRRGHEGAGAFRDMYRDNAATTDGLATLRYGYRDVVGSPCAVAAQVAANLARRGWTGSRAACHRCQVAA
jgi:very-short-patch-repair endonuclease